MSLCHICKGVVHALSSASNDTRSYTFRSAVDFSTSAKTCYLCRMIDQCIERYDGHNDQGSLTAHAQSRDFTMVKRLSDSHLVSSADFYFTGPSLRLVHFAVWAEEGKIKRWASVGHPHHDPN